MAAMNAPSRSNADQSMVVMLQTRMSEALDLSSRAHEAHLNAPLPRYAPFHIAIETLEHQLNECADELAKGLSEVGGHARASAQATAAISTLPQYPHPANGSATHVNAVITSLCDYRRKIEASRVEAETVGAVSTMNVITTVSRKLDFALFELGSFAA